MPTLGFVFCGQGGGAAASRGADRGVRGGQAGVAHSAVPAEGAGDDGGEGKLAEEGGGPVGAGESAAASFSTE